jgi:signal transduction histidine kinase
MASITADRGAAEAQQDVKSGVDKINTSAMKFAFIARALLAALQSIALAHWLGWGWTSAWMALVLLNEYVIVPYVTKRYINPKLAAGETTDAEHAAILLTIYGTLAHMSGWASAWIVGGDSFTVIAALSVCGSLVHAQTYLTMLRSLYFTSAGPPVVFALVMPWFLRDPVMPAWLLEVCFINILIVFAMAKLHTGSMEELVKHLRREWRIAQDANQAKSQFLATMSHELRTPLNAVIGYAEILEETLRDDQRHEDARDAQRIHGAARNLLVMINEILDLSKIEAGKMDVSHREASVRAIVDDVVQTTAHIAERNGDVISVTLDLDHEMVMTDPTKVRQCLLNLVSNACKFTQHGTITIAARQRGNTLAFDVADTGVGMDGEEMERLFQPFVQLDGSHTRRQGGTGLGLAITRKLANLMGGDVGVRSVPNEGSVFSLWLQADGVAMPVVPAKLRAA